MTSENEQRSFDNVQQVSSRKNPHSFESLLRSSGQQVKFACVAGRKVANSLGEASGWQIKSFSRTRDDESFEKEEYEETEDEKCSCV